jgi:enterochelin esterase-like enzyme
MNSGKTYLLLLLISLTSQAISQEEALRIHESLSMYSPILGQEVKYSLLLPENYYTSNEKYPVVYLLHGLGDDETSWLEYGRISQIADQLTMNKEIVPMIFVMPQGFRNYYVNDYAATFRYQDMFISELIPFIDSCYRTIADKKHRATMGYSMGGFGALILPLKNPEFMNTCVPLSISIRTDEQYMEEDGMEWDQQWGRLFGGVGKMGIDRITEYYKQNNPFYLFKHGDINTLSALKIYIDNGDDEYTLCRSNEELHMLLRELSFPHEFRVRDGGHEFSYWRSALPNGLCFISDAFEGKPYRGDFPVNVETIKTSDIQIIDYLNPNGICKVYLPDEYKETSRKYPVIYITGNLKKQESEQIITMIHEYITKGELPPLVVALLPNKPSSLNDPFITNFEKDYRIREGFRFRALMGFSGSGATCLNEAFKPEKYAACVLFNSELASKEIEQIIAGIEAKKVKRTWLYFAAADKALNFQGNGTLHILLREKEVYHEYRVCEGIGQFEELSGLIIESLFFIAKKFHN